MGVYLGVGYAPYLYGGIFNLGVPIMKFTLIVNRY